MAQLRHDYDQFKALNTEVLVMVPNGPRMIERYRQQCHPPYPILVDKGSKVADTYFQTKTMFFIGNPTVFLVGKCGEVLYVHYAKNPIEEPDNREPLSVLSQQAGGQQG